MEMGGVDRGAREHRGARLVAVLATVASAVVLWVAYATFGVDLRSPAFGEHGGTAEVGLGSVTFVSASAAFAAWALLALLERLTPRARRIWLVVAVLALVASLGGPMSGTGITDANRIALLGFHLLVGAVLVPLLYRTTPVRAVSPTGRREERRPVEATTTRKVAA